MNYKISIIIIGLILSGCGRHKKSNATPTTPQTPARPALPSILYLGRPAPGFPTNGVTYKFYEEGNGDYTYITPETATFPAQVEVAPFVYDYDYIPSDKSLKFNVSETDFCGYGNVLDMKIQNYKLHLSYFTESGPTELGLISFDGSCKDSIRPLHCAYLVNVKNTIEAYFESVAGGCDELKRRSR